MSAENRAETTITPWWRRCLSVGGHYQLTLAFVCVLQSGVWNRGRSASAKPQFVLHRSTWKFTGNFASYKRSTRSPPILQSINQRVMQFILLIGADVCCVLLFCVVSCCVLFCLRVQSTSHLAINNNCCNLRQRLQAVWKWKWLNSVVKFYFQISTF